MSGFRDDVISILRQNDLYHKTATGLVLGKSNDGLLEELQKKGFPVIGHFEKDVILFDYIVMNRFYEDARSLMSAFASVNVGGLIIMELDDGDDYGKTYVSQFGSFTATKVKYGDNQYLVIHSGVDYGN
jgi:hypothetical protein